MKRNMGPLKDSPCPYREVQLASVAAVEAILAVCDSFLALTLGAANAVRPETAFQILTGRRFVGEQLKQFEGADG